MKQKQIILISFKEIEREVKSKQRKFAAAPTKVFQSKKKKQLNHWSKNPDN